MSDSDKSGKKNLQGLKRGFQKWFKKKKIEDR